MREVQYKLVNIDKQILEKFVWPPFKSGVCQLVERPKELLIT